MKKILFLIIGFIFSFLSVNTAFAENFDINNYDVNITVTEDNKVHVNELIDVTFTSSAHGIYRNIPLRYNIRYPDGTERKAKSKISNVSATEKVPGITIQNNDYVIKMGNPNRYVSGNKLYNISYDYTLADPNYKDGQEFYFNIIGSQWATNIKKVHFKVTMPKDFDTNKIGLSVGRYGTAGNNNSAYFTTNGRVINGWTTRNLMPNEAVTIRIELPQEYFVTKTNTNTSEQVYTVSVILAALALVAFLIWFIYGKDEKVIPVVTFYPPENHNSAEIGTEYSGQANDKEVVSLIFYLASKGYLEIKDEELSFTLTKLKEYDGKNPYEKKMMRILFPLESTSVTKEDLVAMHFYNGCAEIKKMLNDKVKSGIFDKNACTPQKILILLGCIFGILAVTLYILGGFSFEILSDMISQGIIFLLLFPTIAIIVLVLAFSSNSPISLKVFALIWSSLFGGIPVAIIFSSLNILDNNINIPVLLFALVCLVISIVCLVNLPKRNKRGRILLGGILGLKKFLEVAEKHRIETLISENRNYCYDMLPFAYVLGVADKWVKNFEGITIEPPTWWKSTAPITAASFAGLSSMVASTAAPVSSSSGGFSGGGGGFSGGGGGGGGGGSW